MKLKISMFWNKKPILTGECTNVIAYENIKILRQQFSGGPGSKHTKFVGDWPTLSDLTRSRVGDRFSGEIIDPNGRALYTLEILEVDNG